MASPRAGTRLAAAALAAATAACLPAPAAGSIRLIGNEDGRVAAVFQPLRQEQRPVHLRAFSPGGRLGAAETVIPAGTAYWDVAVSPAGDVAAAWSRYERGRWRVFATTRAAGGALQPPQQLGLLAADAVVPDVAASASGDALVLWYPGGSSPLQIATARIGEPFGSVTDLGEPGGDYRLGVADDGEAVAVWRRYTSEVRDIRAAVRPPGGAFGPAATLSDAAGGSVTLGDLAVGPAGHAMVSWLVGDIGEGGQVLGAWRGPGAPFGPPVAVSGSDARALPHALAVNRAGRTLAVWSSAGRRLRSAVGEGGVFAAPATIGTLDGQVGAGAALNDRGDAAVAWRSDYVVRSAVMPAAGGFAPAHTLWRPGFRHRVGHSYRAPGVAIRGDGVPTVGWEVSDGATVREVVREVGPGRRRVLHRSPAFVREGPRRACNPRRSVTLAADREARVFTWRGRYAVAYACLYRRGRPVPLTLRLELHTFALASPLAAWADTYCDDIRCYTGVTVVDLRDESNGVSRSAAAITVAETGQVGSIRLKPNGAMAWIACPNRSGDHFDEHCAYRDTPRYVYKLDAAARRPRLLDRGRGIDPRSLRLRGSRLTWRDGGRIRSAALR